MKCAATTSNLTSPTVPKPGRRDAPSLDHLGDVGVPLAKGIIDKIFELVEYPRPAVDLTGFYRVEAADVDPSFLSGDTVGARSFRTSQYRPSCLTESANCSKSTGFRT